MRNLSKIKKKSDHLSQIFLLGVISYMILDLRPKILCIVGIDRYSTEVIRP